MENQEKNKLVITNVDKNGNDSIQQNECKVSNKHKSKDLLITLKEVFSLSFIKELKWYEWVIIAIMTVSQLLLTIFTEINVGKAVFNYSISLAGFLYLVCATRCSFWIFIFGLYQPLAYGFVCLNTGIYGEMLVNFAYFAPIQIVGIILWLKNYKKHSAVLCENINVKHLKSKHYLVLLFILIVFYISIYFIISNLNGQRIPYLDAFISVMSIIGTGLLTLRYVENWIAYLIVNFASLIMWTILAIQGNTDAPYYVVLYVAYILYSLIGFSQWNKAVKIKR